MNKCELFKQIADKTWNEICRNHGRNNRLSEEGISRNTVISMIQDYVEDHSTFSVFAQKSKKEVESGGDVEIYIDNGNQQFYRILLQAKLMEVNGRFEHLNRYSGSTERRQYDTLTQFSDQIGADAYYLMYNGCPDFSEMGSDCAGLHNERQYGCALLKPDYIKHHCESTSSGTLGTSASSRPFGVPWRILACCDYSYNTGSKLYTPSQIDLDPYFKDLFQSSDRTSFITAEQMSNNQRILTQNSAIHKNGWQPSGRIIVSKSGMHKNRNGMLEI